jgi:serine/threonine protein kinase
MDAQESSSAPLAAGQVLEGKYRVAKALGGGAMGIVYEGYHLRLQKAVAIKVLRPELAAVEDLRDRFEAEARAAAAIGHPNIVTVTDLGQTPDGALYFVMDRLRGESLGQRLEREGRLDVAATTTIALEVLSGLEAAHALRLVHRDLKPDNIFLAKSPGGRETAKILDFGIAKALASVGRRSKGTQVGMTVGTPLYMAPEQALADPDIDQRADIYALGVILYQTLSGRPPFEGKDSVSVLAAAMTQTAPSLARLCPAAPPALIGLIDSAMSRDRDNRPASTAIFLSRLHAATAGHESVPTPKVAPAFNATSLAALDSAVLVDLAGNPLNETPPPVAAYVEPHFAPPESEELPLATAEPVRPSPRETHVISPEEHAPERRRRRVALRPLLWIVPVGVLAAAGVALGPGLLARARQADLPAAAAAEARPMAMVQFDVSPRGSRLYLDGAPLVSNPVSLGKGEVHTVTAVAEGYDVGASKFFVDQAKTVRLKLLERGRGRR